MTARRYLDGAHDVAWLKFDAESITGVFGPSEQERAQLRYERMSARAEIMAAASEGRRAFASLGLPLPAGVRYPEGF